MSHPPCDDLRTMKQGMETIVEGAVKKVQATGKYCPVTLEPELEEDAALMTPEERLATAEKLRRWARQLEVSAHILREHRRRLSAPKPMPSLKTLPISASRRN